MAAKIPTAQKIFPMTCEYKHQNMFTFAWHTARGRHVQLDGRPDLGDDGAGALEGAQGRAGLDWLGLSSLGGFDLSQDC